MCGENVEGRPRVDPGGKVERGACEAACREKASPNSRVVPLPLFNLLNKGGSSEGKN